jgi:1,4-alpha-glucan branching enzyme
MSGEGNPATMRRASNDRGSLCIVLHSHMPYVEGFGTWPFGEEWLFEAIASVYLPLISCLERAGERGEAEVATVGVTPVLADQLALDAVGDRFLRFMRETRAECHRLDTEGLEKAGQADAAAALRLSAMDYEDAAIRFESHGRDLLGSLRRLASGGVIELWASAATHAVLPLLATEAGVRLQVSAGIEAHRLRFGSWGGGFWLPECAFSDGIDEALFASGVRVFCVDQTNAGEPLDQLELTATVGGAVAVPIDWRTISLVWHDRGYPSHPLYRDYHAHTTNGLRAWANSGRPYDRDAAIRRARDHARDFVSHVVSRLTTYRSERGRPGLVVCALDTELLGHWWYEGPVWLEAVIEHALEARLDIVTLRRALERHEPRRRRLRRSSWGVGKDLRTWDSPVAADLVWSARRAELKLTAAVASRCPVASCERAARELLALQSSDWAFMATRDLAADYPWRRVAEHATSFERALAPCEGGVDSGAMATPLAPELRGLAPELRLDPLFAPASSWGRDAAEPLGGE